MQDLQTTPGILSRKGFNTRSSGLIKSLGVLGVGSTKEGVQGRLPQNHRTDQGDCCQGCGHEGEESGVDPSPATVSATQGLGHHYHCYSCHMTLRKQVPGWYDRVQCCSLLPPLLNTRRFTSQQQLPGAARENPPSHTSHRANPTQIHVWPES